MDPFMSSQKWPQYGDQILPKTLIPGMNTDYDERKVSVPDGTFYRLWLDLGATKAHVAIMKTTMMNTIAIICG